MSRLFLKLKDSRFFHFLFTGGFGVLIALSVTWILTHFIFGTEHYFYGYLVGVACNLLFNFSIYTHVVFKTKNNHAKRLFIFIAYNLAMTYLQARIIAALTPLVGVQYYLFVITSVIGVFSICSFLLFKLSLFKEHEPSV